MKRIQLHLTDEQDRRLRAAAKREAKSRAEIIRLGIEMVLEQRSPANDPLLDLIGSIDVPTPRDVAERHDEYLYGRRTAKRKRK